MLIHEFLLLSCSILPPLDPKTVMFVNQIVEGCSIQCLIISSSIPNIICIKLQSRSMQRLHDLHYIAKSIESPPSNERFDYFSNFHEYKS